MYVALIKGIRVTPPHASSMLPKKHGSVPGVQRGQYALLFAFSLFSVHMPYRKKSRVSTPNRGTRIPKDHAM